MNKITKLGQSLVKKSQLSSTGCGKAIEFHQEVTGKKLKFRQSVTKKKSNNHGIKSRISS